MAELDSFDESSESREPRAELHLADYWAVVVKRRRLIVAIVALSLIGGALATTLTAPMYMTQTVIDVERQADTTLPFAASRGEGGPASEFLPSQIRLMQSREIAERVLIRLNLLADPDFNRKHFQNYRPDAKGVVRQPTRDEIAEAAIDVQDSVDPEIVRGTSLVELTARARSPRLAAAMANAMADSYIDWNIESRFKAMGQSAQFLERQISEAKAEIQEKERGLLAYGRQKDIVAGEPGSNPALQRLESVNRDLAGAVADRVAKQARYEEVRAQRPEMLADANSAGILSVMRSELQRLQRDYAEKLTVYKPEWPAMQQLNLQIEQAQKNLAATAAEAAAKVVEAARTEYVISARREQSLKDMSRTGESEAFAQGSNAVEYKNVRVEIDSKRALLDSLIKRQGEIEMLSRMRDDRSTNIRVVDRALEPEEPYKPSLKKNMLAALVLGTFLGIGFAISLSYLDRSLRTADQVERLLRLPALGIIPAGPAPHGATVGRLFRKDNRPAAGAEPATSSIDLLAHREPRSPGAEAYRAFRTSLLLSRAGGVKTIVVTSALAHEGKTTTGANLAVVLGQLGRRVLLVDADLHQPRIHELFQISNRIGLVSVLAEGIEPSRAIVKTPIPGVFVVPSGPPSPNPSGLLSSDAMRKFMELGATNFDYVIVDTPPVLPVSDTLVFAQQADGVVICVRGGKTSREQVTRARDLLIRSSVIILGVLINGLEPEPGRLPLEYGYSAAHDAAQDDSAEAAAPAVTSTT